MGDPPSYSVVYDLQGLWTFYFSVGSLTPRDTSNYELLYPYLYWSPSELLESFRQAITSALLQKKKDGKL
jgi:hypothetical protein